MELIGQSTIIIQILCLVGIKIGLLISLIALAIHAKKNDCMPIMVIAIIGTLFASWIVNFVCWIVINNIRKTNRNWEYFILSNVTVIIAILIIAACSFIFA